MVILQLWQTTQSKMNMLFVFILENDNAFCQKKKKRKKNHHGIWDELEPNMSFITFFVSVFSFSCFHGICLALNSLAMQNPLTIYGKTCLFHHQTNWIWMIMKAILCLVPRKFKKKCKKKKIGRKSKRK